MVGAAAVGGNVEGLGVVQHLEDVTRGWGGDDGGGDDLVHCFVVAGVAGVVEETGAAAVDVWEGVSRGLMMEVGGDHTAREKGHADAFLLCNTLQCADQVCTF